MARTAFHRLEDDDGDSLPAMRPLSSGSNVSAIGGSKLVAFPNRRRKFQIVDDEDSPPPVKIKDDLFISRQQTTPIVKRAIVIPSLRRGSGERLPPSLVRWAVSRGVARAQGPFKKPRSQVFGRGKEREKFYVTLPPSLHAWAVARGIKSAAAPKPIVELPKSRRSPVAAIEARRQVYEALRRGEWCYSDEISYFSSPLKEWLKHCRVRLLRHEGGGRVSGTPVNGYVTEDGTIFYVAEDGATFYVQES